ncbi:hypothetical protein CTI12_AA507470 [Artemisia annua]|uniref:Uncharacterized protein n=1 Tax=Artemisia annua TaxID=35608 RepID=A0A2U1LC69_ARTAN|nr:hypothetical protein CTI12_AA507470 [Artemisia annua]
MSACFSYLSSRQLCLLLLLALFQLSLSNTKFDDVILRKDSKKQTLLLFKHNLIDEAIDLLLGLVRRVIVANGLGLFVITSLLMFIVFIFLELMVIVMAHIAQIEKTKKHPNKG